MQVISVSDTAAGVEVSQRALPAALQVLFAVAFLGFVAFVMINADMSEGNWLPPFDRLPRMAQDILRLVLLAAGCALPLWMLIKGLRVLLQGEVWQFDAASRLVIFNGKTVVAFDEIKALRIEGDFSGDAPASLTLAIATRAGRPIKIAQDNLHEAQFERFLDVARRVRTRMKIPYETVGIPERRSGWSFPSWWPAR